MRGVAAWLDNTIQRDPDDKRGIYGESRSSFAVCGNRGLQSSCDVEWCVDGNRNSAGNNASIVPGGGNPYVDPNKRNRLCSWL
jgi:hypothetical protein